MAVKRNNLRVVLVPICLLSTSNVRPQDSQKSEPQQASPDLQEIIRVQSDLVVLSVTVRDRNGNLVSGLKREDFHVSDEGVEQESRRSLTRDFHSRW